MSNVLSETIDALAEIESNDYNIQAGVVWMHPRTAVYLDEELAEQSPHYSVSHGQRVIQGVPVETTSNIPEKLVVVMHWNAGRYGTEAITFRWVSYE